MTIRNIPNDLPVGTAVRVEVSIEADYHIHAHASVPSIGRTVSLNFCIDPVDTASLTTEYILDRIKDLRKRAEKEAAECRREKEVEIFRVRLNALYADVEMELNEAEPNRLKIREKLVGMEALVRDISIKDEEIQMPGLSFEEFSKRLVDIETRALENSHPRLAEVKPQIERLRSDGAEAWRTKDRISWLQACNQIPSIGQALMPELSPEEFAEALASFIVHGQLPEIQQATGKTNELAEIEADVRMTVITMRTGGVRPEAASEKLRHCYRTRILPLRQRLGLDAVELPDGRMTSVGTGLTRRALG